MKNKINAITAIFFIYLLMVSPLSLAQEEENFQPGQGEPNQQQEFLNNPTPENFNQLPNPTAADLIRLGDAATVDNFKHLMNNDPQQASSYLEQRYNNDFAQNFYDEPSRLGINPALDDRYISGDGSKDQSSDNIGSNLPVAATYFTGKFGKKFTMEAVPPGFAFDAKENVVLITLPDGKEKKYPAIKAQEIIGVRVTSTEVLLIPAEGEEIGEISTAGNRAGSVNYQKGGHLIFTDDKGKENVFSITGSKATRFNILDDGSYEIEGPVSGMVNIDNDHAFAEFRNRQGKLMIRANGDIEARDALVETAKLYLDGRFEYHKEENKVDAYEVMSNDRKTIIVDKDSRVGAKTQGQIKGESTLSIFLSAVSENSEYFAKPDAGQRPTVQEVIDDLQEIRPPQGDIGDNAEVYIKKNSETGKTIVTAKGKVEVGFYDTVPGSISLSEREPRFVGVNGISEFDLLSGPQSQVNIRGQAVYSDDQYSRIDTQQNGASLKIIKNDFDDVIHSGCFQCAEGSTALSISKQVTVAVQEGDVFSQPVLKTISMSATVTSQGLAYQWDTFLSDLGSLASAKTAGQQVIVGKNLLLKSIVCEGNQQCNFMLSRDQQSGKTAAFYEIYDPQTNQVSKKVVIPTDLGETIGKATILTSADNVQKLQQIQSLVEQRKFGEVSVLLKGEKFDEDPALRQHLLKTTGIDIQQLDNPTYTEKLNSIVKNYADAQEKIRVLRENYGINLDENGAPATEEDQRKLNEILNKRRRGSEIAVFDLYTGARVNLARAEKEQLEVTHQSCAGSAYCLVGDEEVKAAQQKVATEILRRERSPEGIAWREDFELQKERQKEAELLKENLADAQKLGEKKDKTERELTRDQAVLAQTLQEIQDQEAEILRLEQERRQVEESVGLGDFVFGIVLTAGEGYEEKLAQRRSEEETARQALSSLQQQKFSLEKRIENGKEGLKNVNEEITGLTLDFKEPTSKLALLNAYGDDETVGAMILDSDLPQATKEELLQTYLGPEASERIIKINSDKSVPYDERQQQINKIIGTGKPTLKQAQNIADMYGDIAGSSIILDQVATARPDLVDTPEWRAAQDAHNRAVDNQLAELRKAAENNVREKIKLRDAKEASVFGNQDKFYEKAISWTGEALEDVGSGIRWVSFKTVAGTLATAGGASYLLGAEETGADLVQAAVDLHTYDDVKHQQADAEIRALNQEIRSYDKVQELIAEARQAGKKPDTQLMQNAFRTQAPIVNLAKQIEGQELTVDDQAQAALYNVEQSALVAGGDALVKNQYTALDAEYAGKSEVANIARERVDIIEQDVEGTFLSRENLALYGDTIIDAGMDVTNLIPGAAFAKVAQGAAKIAEVTKITAAVTKFGKAIDTVKDAGKLLAVSGEARLALKAAKTELYAAQTAKGLTVADRAVDIARAEQKVNLARQAVEAEYRASRLGKVTYVLSAPVSSERRALNTALAAAQDEQLKAAQRLQEAVSKQEAGAVPGFRGSAAEELRRAQEAYETATQRIDDIEKAKEAYSLADSDLGTLFEGTALGKQRAVGPGAKKAQQALDEFKAAREQYHAERTLFGAAGVSQQTTENVIKTAKAAEEASFGNRMSDAIRGAIGVQRVERNVNQLKAAKIALSFTDEGKLVAEGVAAGSDEARLVDRTNQLLEDDRVLQNLVGEDARRIASPEDIPEPPRKLSAEEFEELEALDKELEARGATYKLNDDGTAEINIDEIITEDAQDLEQLKQKAQRAQQLFDDADKEELLRQVRSRRNAEAALTDNDVQSIAQEVKEDLAAKARGEIDSGAVPEIAGEKAAALPKPLADTKTRASAGDDLPRPEAIEEAIDSRSAGTHSVLQQVQQEGKIPEVRGLDKLSGDVTAEENAQIILAAVPESGSRVRVETINGNVYEGEIISKDEDLIVLEAAGKKQAVATGKVDEVKELARAEKPGVSDAVDSCTLAAAAIYGLAPCTGVTRVSEDTVVAPVSEPVVPISQVRLKKREIPLPKTGDPAFDTIVEVLETHSGGRLRESDLEKLVAAEDYRIGSGAESIVYDVPDEVLEKINQQRRAAGKAEIDGPVVLKIKNDEVGFGNSPEWLQKIQGDLCAARAATCLEDIGEKGIYQIVQKAEGPELSDLVNAALTEKERDELAKIDNIFSEFSKERETQVLRQKALIEQKAFDESRELTKEEISELAKIDYDLKVHVQELNRVRIQQKQEILSPLYEQGWLDEATIIGSDGQLKVIKVREKTEELFTRTRELNTEVLDAHYHNIKCLDPDCDELVFVDLGAAVQGKNSLMQNPGVAEDYARNALTGGNFDISPAYKRLHKQNLEPVEGLGVTSIVDNCAVAGGAIFGLGACPLTIPPEPTTVPFDLERRVEVPSPEVSGVRLKTVLTDPASLVVPGEEQWNDLVAIIKKHEGELSLGQSDLEKLTQKSDPDFLGRGLEGVVRRVPEDARVALSIEKPAVVKIRNYGAPNIEETAHTFPEAAELLQSIEHLDVAPEVYRWGDNYYIVEELQGNNPLRLAVDKLTPDELQLYIKLPKGAEKDSLLQLGISRARPELEPLLDDLVSKLSEAGVVVDDLHMGNVKLVPTPQGSKAKVVDVGFAYTTDPETAALINAAKKEEFLQGGGQGVNPILKAVRQNQRESAQQAFTFFNDFPAEAEALLTANPQQLRLALRRAGVENEQIISYILVPEGRNRIIDRMFEGNADPLTVALKLEEKPVTHLGEGAFGFEGKQYYRAADGNWKQRRTFWVDKTVEDSRIIDELEAARADLSIGGDLRPCSVGGAIAGQAIGCVNPSVASDAVFDEGAARFEGKEYQYDSSTNQYTRKRWYWADEKVPIGSDLHHKLETARIEKAIQPKKIDDLQEGKYFLRANFWGEYRQGIYQGNEVDPFGFTVIRYKADFGGSYVVDSEQRVIPSIFHGPGDTVVVQGDFVRVRTASGEIYGRYDGGDVSNIRITNTAGEQSEIKALSPEFDSLIAAGDEVLVKSNFPTSYRGRYVDEVRGKYIREDTDSLTLYVDGEVVKLDKKNVDTDSLRKVSVEELAAEEFEKASQSLSPLERERSQEYEKILQERLRAMQDVEKEAQAKGIVDDEVILDLINQEFKARGIADEQIEDIVGKVPEGLRIETVERARIDPEIIADEIANEVAEGLAVQEALKEAQVAEDVVLPPCPVGGAIAGLAPCLPAEIPEAAVSGERIIQAPVIESEPLPLEQVEEVITPEKILQPQRIIQEKEGVVIQSENNLYFVDEEGKVSSVYLDNTYTLRPKEEIIVDPVLEQELVNLAEEVRTGKIVPLDVPAQEKYKIALVEAAKDRRVGMLVGSPEFDAVLINPHGTHQQYLEKLDDTIEGNRNLQYLQQKFAEAGTPVSYSRTVPERHLPEAQVAYSYNDASVVYKVFADEEEILDAATKLGYEGNDLMAAKKIIAEKQIQTAAGHETYHHAFQQYLTPEQREAWIQYVRETNDPAIKSAVNSIINNPAYQQTAVAKGLSPEESWVLVADEVFAHRNDFHAFGPSGIPVMELPASPQELKLLKEMNIIPPDFRPPTEVVVLGEGFYELNGKKYYKTAQGTWKEDVSFWFDRQVEDQTLVQELELACVSC